MKAKLTLLSLTALAHVHATAQEIPACITNVEIVIPCSSAICQTQIIGGQNHCGTNNGSGCSFDITGGDCLLSSSCSTNDGALIQISLYQPAPTGGIVVGSVTIKCSDGSSDSKNIVVPAGKCWAELNLCAECPPCKLTVHVYLSTTGCPCGQ